MFRVLCQEKRRLCDVTKNIRVCCIFIVILKAPLWSFFLRTQESYNLLIR